MENKLILGIHVGSTGTEAAVVDVKGSEYSIIIKEEIRPQGHDKKTIIDGVNMVINKIFQKVPKDKIQGSGISTSGPVDIKNKIVHGPPSLNWANVNIEQEFGAILPSPIFVDDDADAAALAEMQLGKGKGIDNFVCLMLCTGIGSGIVINKNIYRGYEGLAGEIGHQTIDYNGPLCHCSNHGCLETYASGWAIVKKMKENIQLGVQTKLISKLNDLSYLDICKAADEGDKPSINLLKETGRYLGIGIANMLNILAHDKIIITGKLSKGYTHFKEHLEEEVRIRAFSIAHRILPTETTGFGDNMDVFAAAATFLFQNENQQI